MPAILALVVQRLEAGVRIHERVIAGAQTRDARIRRSDGAMRQVDQDLLHMPQVVRRAAPVVASERPQVEHAVAGDASADVDVGLDVAAGEIAQRAEDRLAAVQSRVARPCDAAPAGGRAVHEDHVIELVLGLEAHHQRRPAVGFEDHRGAERRFHAVSGAERHDGAEGPLRVALGFGVVGQGIEPPLHLQRRAQAGDEALLAPRELAGRHQQGRVIR